MAFEEMVSGDEYQLFRVGGFGNEFLQRILRAVLIVVAADEELGFGAVPQERKRVKASIGFDRRTDRDDCANVTVGTRSSQTRGRSEGEPGEDDGQRELMLQPSQRGLHIGYLAASLVVLASAQAGAAKVEAQHGKAERVQCLHGVKNDLVVHGPASQRVRMAHQSGMGRGGRSHIEQGFQPSCRSLEKECLDCGVRRGQPSPALSQIVNFAGDLRNGGAQPRGGSLSPAGACAPVAKDLPQSYYFTSWPAYRRITFRSISTKLGAIFPMPTIFSYREKRTRLFCAYRSSFFRVLLE